MNDLFVPYKESLELKELGFDKPCVGYWSNWGNQEPSLLTCELGNEKESSSIRRKNFLKHQHSHMIPIFICIYT